MAKSNNSLVYQVKITLRHVKPPVWRRLLLAGDLGLDHVHDIFQAAMGWTDSHLHAFTINKRTFGVPYPGSEHERMIDESQVTLSQLRLSAKSKFHYEYDFGDGWEHDVLVEKIIEAVAPPAAVLLDGERACPPEDCGGPWGYAQALEALEDNDHPDHEDMKEWMGDVFDPDAFDPSRINQYLSRLVRQS